MNVHLALNSSDCEIIDATFRIYEYIVGKVVQYRHPKTQFMIYSVYPDPEYYGVQAPSIIQYCNDTSKITAKSLGVRRPFSGLIVGDFTSCVNPDKYVEYALAVHATTGIICRVIRSTT